MTTTYYNEKEVSDYLKKKFTVFNDDDILELTYYIIGKAVNCRSRDEEKKAKTALG